MKILMTGATGYIGSHLLPVLLDQGHNVVVLVRRISKDDGHGEKTTSQSLGLNVSSDRESQITIIQGNLLSPASLINMLPNDIEAAYYLVHSMSDSSQDFAKMELNCANNFIQLLRSMNLKQIIYLSGISTDRSLSSHLTSRKAVEYVFKMSGLTYTILKCAMIIGSGSASFEIVRDLSEKLPVMIAPRWVDNKTQPIAIDDVIFYLKSVLLNTSTYNQEFEIGGPEQRTYKEMLLDYSRKRGLKRAIITVPVLTPRLSSYWLYLVTSVNFSLATSLVESLRNQTVCTDFAIQTLIPHKCLNYEEAIDKALSDIDQNTIISSWRNTVIPADLQDYIHVPTNGCLFNKQIIMTDKPREEIIETIWSLGGQNGWGYANWAWELRGLVDKIFGGVGLNRGRTNPNNIKAGDIIDFWRVIVADRKAGRLLLYAEMKLPGDAWLEFKVVPHHEKSIFEQTATFRPKGLLGRLYWYILIPIHFLIFRGMANAIVKKVS